MKHPARGIVWLVLAVLCACGPRLEGTYRPPDGAVQFAFRPDGHVELTALGQTRVGTYKVADGKVYITTGTETRAFRLLPDGCIEGGFAFGRLCKR